MVQWYLFCVQLSQCGLFSDCSNLQTIKVSLGDTAAFCFIKQVFIVLSEKHSFVDLVF